MLSLSASRISATLVPVRVDRHVAPCGSGPAFPPRASRRRNSGKRASATASAAITATPQQSAPGVSNYGALCGTVALHGSALHADLDDVSTLDERVVADFIAGHTSLPTEHEYWLDAAEIEGQIPPELSGTLFRNGPGLFEIGGKKLNQPFDGDGMICRISIKDGAVQFKNTFVRTQGYVDEQKAGKFIYKGAFTTGNPSGGFFFNPFDFDVKNVANTHVVYWGGKLLALWEGGLPHELDPRTLATIGPTTLNGTLPDKGPFAAHYKIHNGPNERRLVNFGASIAGTDSELRFYEFAESGECVRKRGFKVPDGAFGFYHDFVVTDNYYIVYQNPVKMDYVKLLTQYMTGRCCIAECLVFDPTAKMQVHAIPRSGDTTAGAKTFKLDPHFVFHHGNAYETEDGRIVCDSVAWRSVDFGFSLDTLNPGYYDGGQRSELHRYEFNLKTGAASRVELAQRPVEFPAVNPKIVGRKHKHIFVPGSAVDHPRLWGPNQVLVKFTETEGGGKPTSELWWAGERKYVQEAVFVPRAGASAEDAGWLMSLVYDAERNKTDLVIVDAERMSEGPVATVHFRHLVPFGLHGSWSDAHFAGARV